MGGTRPGWAGRIGAVVAVTATVVMAVGLWTVWLTPAEAIRLVAPVLEDAEPAAARTGDPVTRWEVPAAGTPPDADAPLLAALATLPPDVTVAVRRMPVGDEPSWQQGALLEVGREGYIDRACLLLRRPGGGAVVRWELRGLRLPLRWPIGAGCDTVARGAPPALVVRDGEVSAPAVGGRP